MPNFAVLLPSQPMPLIMNRLARHFTVLRLWEQDDKPGFLARHRHEIQAIAGGLHGGRIDAAYMQQFPNLKIISGFGVGYDGIDAAWAGQNGIIVTNTPDVLSEEVADTALGLLLCAVRELPRAERHVREGRWLQGSFPLSASLRNRTMGILGLGRIGKAIARRAEACGVKVVYHGRSQQPDVTQTYYPALLEMARDVDILMIVTPGGEATRHLVNRDVLKALGPEGVLINVSRGSVVDEAALIEALQAKTIRAAGLDVFEHEPNVPAALLALDNAVLLPHVGSGSVETRRAMAQLVVDNVVSFAAGKEPLTPVPETPWLERGV